MSVTQKRPGKICEKMRKIDNSGEHRDINTSMDTSMICGRTRHEAATMEQTIRDIMRNTTSEGNYNKSLPYSESVLEIRNSGKTLN